MKKTFTILEIDSLKDLMYRSCIHDASITEIYPDFQSATVKINTRNRIFDKSINFLFEGVQTFLFTKGTEVGSPQEILSLGIDEKDSIVSVYEKKTQGFLHIVFYMFCDDEYHIVAEYVTIDDNE